MKKVKVILAVMLLAFVASSCGDKIQAAKTTLVFVNLGISTADTAFRTADAAKRTECLKKGAEGTPAFESCYKGMKEVMAKWVLIRPKLNQASQNAAAYIRAVESGGTGDYIAAITESVCLLVQVAEIIPGDWKKKIEAFLALVGSYACPKVSTGLSPQYDLYLLKQAHKLMSEMLGQVGA